MTHGKPLFPPVETDECQRGRHERRRLTVFPPVGIDRQQWPGVRALLCVERTSTRQGNITEYRQYSIRLIATSPQRWMRLVCNHWRIENRLHWGKDVVLNEDRTDGRNSMALLNASLFRSIAINLLGPWLHRLIA